MILLIISLCFGISLGDYMIGSGISDITGPVVEINMMGYANPGQINSGIHTRLFSRAFIISDVNNKSPVVFVSIDHGMASQIVKTKVSKKLTDKYGSIYSDKNVMISATHTHSGPAGFFQYVLYVVTSKGFVRQSFDALVDGIVESIEMAHNNLSVGKIFINKGNLHGSSINRSPVSYLNNPKSERDEYKYNVDTEMTVLKMVKKDGSPIGMINWFAVHGVSMPNTNTLTSSDNKGVAALLFESAMNKNALPGKGKFVAAFAQANEGDVSPNTKGPHCTDTGKPCDLLSSTCNGRVEKCIGTGPGKDAFESTKIIGTNQFEKAKELYDSATVELTGPVNYIHQNIDMSNREVQVSKNGSMVTEHTCKPAMGYSFAAGTTDGPGAFDFKQGMKNGTTFWNIVRNFLKKPSKEVQKCHEPKPVLLSVGEMTFPYAWAPEVVETQVFRVGSLLIVGAPGEFTTMSGRRIKKAVVKAAKDAFENGCNPRFADYCKNADDMHAVFAGLSNVYADYIATYEEYQVQRYEGASTIYGPHTQKAFQDQFVYLTKNLIKGIEVPTGPKTPYFVDKVISLVPGVVYDSHPIGKPYGTVLTKPLTIYEKEDDVVKVSFVTANPRNNMRLGETFLTVEKKDESGEEYKVVHTDASWETKFSWKREGMFSEILGRSTAFIEWSVKDLWGKCEPGIYRISHFGTSKSLSGKLTDFVGRTNPFIVSCGL